MPSPEPRSSLPKKAVGLTFGSVLPGGIDAVARGGIARSQARLPAALRAVHQKILLRFLDDGQGPTVAFVRDLATAHRLKPEAAIDALADADLVHFDSAETKVHVAYPLSGRGSAHQVELATGVSVAAMCAVDALGVLMMTGQVGTVSSTDPATGQPLRVARAEDGTWSWDPVETVVVLAASECEGPIAYACRHTAFHADGDLAQQYLDRHPGSQGTVLTQAQALEIASTEFGPLLQPPGHGRVVQASPRTASSS